MTGTRLKDASEPLVGGELFAFRDVSKGCWRFAKVLGSYPEEGVAFLRTYAQRFPTPPDSIDPTSLRVGTFDDPDGPTIGCAPIRYESVRDDWLASPDYGRLPITEEELDSVRETIQMMEDDA